MLAAGALHVLELDELCSLDLKMMVSKRFSFSGCPGCKRVYNSNYKLIMATTVYATSLREDPEFGKKKKK